MSGKILSRVIMGLAAMLAAINVFAMPSYDDVLVVVNDKSPQSLEIGEYFRNARNIPVVNVCHISVTDLQAKGSEDGIMPLTERNAAVATVKKYIAANKLTDKINYIVLTRGIPMFSYYIQGTDFQLFDLWLLYALSETGTSLIPDYDESKPYDVFTYNKYFYYMLTNANLADYKFTQKKYGYYQVARLDGPGTVNIKKMIDSTGYPAYQSYKKPIKFLTNQPYCSNYDLAYYAEIKARGNIHIVSPDIKNGQVMSDVGQDIMFGYWNRVDQYWTLPKPDSTDITIADGASYIDSFFYYDVDTVIYHPNIFYDISFLPGSMMFCFRSFPSRYNHRAFGGMFKLAPSTGIVTDYQKKDGSDIKFRHMSCVAYDPVNNWVWCGASDNALADAKYYSDTKVSDLTVHKYGAGRGNGIGIFDKDGNILNHLTMSNSPLANNRVVKMVYDKYAKLMWVAHYGGIQYYNLVNKTWSEVTALKNDFAAACEIYVDPYDTDKVYFSFFTNTSSSAKKPASSLITNAETNIFEYSKSAKTVKSYLIDAAVKGIYPLMSKTSANTLWVTKGTNLYKYNLATSSVDEKIDIKSLIPEIAALGTGDSYTLNPPSAMAAVPSSKTVLAGFTCSFNYKAPLVEGKPYKVNLYVLRVTDNDAAPSTVKLVTCQSTDVATFAPTIFHGIWSLLADPLNADKFYLSSSHVCSWVPAALLKSADQGRTWTTQPASAITNLQQITAAPSGAIYGVRSSIYNQQNFSDFQAFGLSAWGGGLAHELFQYGWKRDVPQTGYAPPKHYASQTQGYADTQEASPGAYAMMFMLLDGYYYGEARFSIFLSYPSSGGGGFTAHMMCFEPKCAPYAPRVDEENLKSQVINKTTIEIPLFSPGLPPAMDGFIPETISANTVKITDETGSPVKLSKMEYNAICRKIVLTGDLSGMVYQVVLKCGIDGIKNIKGASLTNTRAGEYKDEITYLFGDGILINPEIYTPAVIAGPVQMPQYNSKCDLNLDKVWWDKAPAAGQPLTVKFQITNIGTVATNAAAGALRSKIYLNNVKMDAVPFGNLAAKQTVTLSSTINGSFIRADKQTTIMVWADADSKLVESRESNNTKSATFFLDSRPDLNVTAITLSSTKAGKVTVNFTIANTGAGATAAGPGAQTAAVYVNGSPAGTVNYDDLAKGAVAALKLDNVTVTAGTCKVKVVADSTGKVTEASESNNITEKLFIITK